jgi:membrane protein insertase Oxa1/YidC/SpoIIIJ
MNNHWRSPREKEKNVNYNFRPAIFVFFASAFLWAIIIYVVFLVIG